METIILDCDGVLLNWRETFKNWLIQHQFLSGSHLWNEDDYDIYPYLSEPFNTPEFALKLSLLFNESYILGKLPPMPGAVDAIKKLHSSGFILKVVSSFTDVYESMKIRENNLLSVFGPVFQEFISLPLFGDKSDYLSKQDKNSYFVEDSLVNRNCAIKVGFNPARCYIIPHAYNRSSHPETDVMRLSWNNIVKDILGE